jgi:hypothetical protein
MNHRVFHASALTLALALKTFLEQEQEHENA